MADISKIERRGITYNIKDEIARRLLQQKYEKPLNGIPVTDLSSDMRVTIEKIKDAIPYLPDKTSKLVYQYGKPIKFVIPLVVRTITIDDGVLSTSDSDFTPSDNYPISIIFDNGRA